MISKFVILKKDFWYFYGIPKKWNECLIEDINLSYEINSKKYKNGFFIFKQLKVIKHPLKLFYNRNMTRKEIRKREEEKL